MQSIEEDNVYINDRYAAIEKARKQFRAASDVLDTNKQDLSRIKRDVEYEIKRYNTQNRVNEAKAAWMRKRKNLCDLQETVTHADKTARRLLKWFHKRASKARTDSIEFRIHHHHTAFKYYEITNTVRLSGHPYGGGGSVINTWGPKKEVFVLMAHVRNHIRNRLDEKYHAVDDGTPCDCGKQHIVVELGTARYNSRHVRVLCSIKDYYI